MSSKGKNALVVLLLGGVGGAGFVYSSMAAAAVYLDDVGVLQQLQQRFVLEP
jgi:hypothetical protein